MPTTKQALTPAEMLGCLDALAAQAHAQIDESRQMLDKLDELRTQVKAYTASTAVVAAREAKPRQRPPQPAFPKQGRAGRNCDFSIAAIAGAR